MDTITHIVLGAAIGEVLAGKRLGKKAMLLGAVAQSLPDIDFVASFWLDTAHDVSAHRGITHSFLFILLLTPLITWLSARFVRAPDMTKGRWAFFFGFELFIHVFLDAFNAYGTGWFEPFEHTRVSFNVLFVADPFYSLWLGIAFLALLILKPNSRRRKGWLGFGLILSSFYLYYCLMNKYKIDKEVRQELERQQIIYTRYFTTPTPFNNWLWYVVAEDSTGFHTGYISIFDRKKTIAFRNFSRNDSLLTPLRNRPDLQNLLKFSQGYYTAERWNDTLVFNDLRFGEMRGWEDPQARFVFHYFLERPDDNKVIVQRGRFAGWNSATLRAFYRRIKGN